MRASTANHHSRRVRRLVSGDVRSRADLPRPMRPQRVDFSKCLLLCKEMPADGPPAGGLAHAESWQVRPGIEGDEQHGRSLVTGARDRAISVR